ncbi:DNA translocase FtsK 4TM domain-containing protein [Candidatus Daviesbacteria bacterium]|nr:DNA translocase FtsK 4TM domain-containing protein [Candidatus Daviesbacteria bacterium]
MARRGRYGPLFKIKLKRQTLIAISAVSSFVFSGLVLLSLSSGDQSVILATLRSMLFKMFGWSTILIPILLILLGLLFLRLKAFIARPNVLVGTLLISISFAAFTGLFSEENAGIVGNELWTGAQEVVTSVGAFILFLAMLVVGFMVIFDTSVDQVFVVIGHAVFLPISIFSKIFSHGDRNKRFKGVFNQERPPLKVKGQESDKQKVDKKITPQKAVREEPLGLGTMVVTNLPATAGGIWEYPPLSLLSDEIAAKAERGDLKQNAQIIEKTLESFGIQARVAEVNLGPAVTQYALELAVGTKISKIAALQNDLALSLATPTGTVRIEAPIPGKSLVGIEVPNRSLEIVSLKHILTSSDMQEARSRLTVALGLDTSSNPIIADIAKMPHILMAGTTGSGKSVCLSAFIASLLYRASPAEVKFIMIDPKRVEFPNFNGIPHLLTPVIVEPDKTLSALKWAMGEMDRRYKLFASAGVRNISGYNELSGFQALPYIMIVIDELADLMAFAPVEVEDAICRLAQMARATGIHLILATQRPSVDVITGLIKANIPCRIAFNVSSMIDSRVIIDQPGAEKLLGRGDMLYLPPDAAKPMRIQGVYISEHEINKLVDFLKQSGVSPEYTEEVTTIPIAQKGQGPTGSEDDLFDEAVRIVCQYDRASASLLQRRLSIGYARAARIIDQLESAGVVGVGEGSKPRDVLVKNAQEFLSQRQTF